MQTQLPIRPRQGHKSETGREAAWPRKVCGDSQSSAPTHSTYEPRVPGSFHFSRKARNLDVCVQHPKFSVLATHFDFQQKHHTSQTQRALRPTRPTGRQFESLVVSICGSLGLEQACHAQAWDTGLGWRRRHKPHAMWE